MDAGPDDRVRASRAPPRDPVVTATPASTIEALAYALRRGLSCLDDPSNRDRLGRCDNAAMKEIVSRLRSWKARNAAWLPAWSDVDIGKLAKAWRTLRDGKT
jgi:hypothetical protein